MAWNEPGGNDKDPWSGKGDQGPPDLDEVVKKMQERLGGLFGRKGGDQGDSGATPPPVPGAANFKGFALLLLAGLILALLYMSIYTIQPAERGVVLRFGAFNSVTEPGPHLLVPFIDEVITVDVDHVNKFSHRAMMLTKDENIVDLSLTVQYRIQDAADYLFQDAEPNKTIVGAMESALREVVGKSTFDEIITTNRAEVAARVLKGSQGLLDNYRTGLIVTAISIQDATAPEAVKAAFEDAIKAREDKERLQNQAEAYANDVVPRARGQAARQIESAKAHRAKVIAEAEGESQRFTALLREYEKAPQVTRERLYLETVQNVLKNSSKVMLDVKEGSNLTYLPLDRMIQQQTPVPQESPIFTPGLQGRQQGGDSTQSESSLRSVDRTRRTR